MAAKRMAKGYKSQLWLGFESEYGVMPASPKNYSLPFNSYGVTLSRTLTQAETISGTRNPLEPFSGNTDVSGDIVVPLDLSAYGYWLRALLGKPTTVASEEPDAGVYTHTFKIQDDVESFWIQTLYATNPASYVLSSGLKISSMSMDMGTDGELTTTLSVMGKNQALSASPVAGVAEKPLFQRLNNNMGKLLLDGEEYGDVTAFTLNVDNGLDGDTYTIGGGGTRGDISEGLSGVSGQLTVLFKGPQLIYDALNSTHKSAKIVFTRTEGSMTFDIQEFLLSAQTPSIDGPAGLRLGMDWQAFWAIGSNESAIMATLVNAHETYADA